MNASGTAPYQISYTRNLVPELYSTSSLQDSLLLNNGTYVFKYMTDANGCIDSLNESVILNDTAISVNVIHQGFSCDSAKHKVQIIAQGKSPLQLNYTKNGVSQTQVLSSGTNTLYFENGNYTFSNLSDANTCMAFINQTFMFNDSLPNFAISNGGYVCDSNKTIIYLNASGKAPYQISYTRNLVPELYSTSSLQDSLLLNNGTYVFKYMTDANGCIDSLNESVILNDTAISVNVIHQGFSCDSAKHKVQIIAQGKSPLQLNYTKNGVSQTQVLSSGTNTLYFENGNYTFANLSDANTCMAFINQTFMFNDSLPNFAISNGVYVCDSNKTIIYLNASGTAPYQISYTRNLVPELYSTSSFEDSLLLNNGTYVFKYMADANGCIDSLNESVILNDTAISVNVIHQGFSCDSAKHKVQIIAQGKSPLQLNYTKNGVSQTQVLSSGTNTLYFENGNYTFQNLSDANTCMAFINQTFMFNDSLPNFAISNGGYVCDSNKTIIYLNASGKAPYQISYTRNLVPELYSTSSLEDSLLLNNGTYVFKYMADANGCIDSLNESIILNDTAISVNVIHQGFSCDSAKHKVQIIAQGKSPLQLIYTKNGVSQTQVLSSGTNTLYFENGNYTFSNLSDANTCMAFINQTFMFNDSLPNFAISNGVYVCDSNKTIIYLNASGTAPYQISYTRNLVPELYSTSSLEDSILLNNGTYVFKYMTDANGCIDSLNESIILNDTAISVNVIHQGFSCDSAKHKVQIIAQGKSPLQLIYTKNGVSQTQVLSSGTNTLYFENGNYTFSNLSDANTCMAFINQTFMFNDSLPNFSISNGVYVCDSNKTIIYLNASGTAPYQISYTRNLVPELYSTSSLEDSLLLNNGTYVFKYMTDANGCIDSLNESVILNDTAISVNVIHQGFSCDSAKHKVQIIAQGKSPLQLNYTKNGVSQTQVLSSGTNTLYFENGNYTFSNLSDANTCMAFINQTFMFNDSLPNFAISNGVYVCDSNKTIIYLNASGTAPYQISYTRNLVPELYSTSSLEDSILLNNGTYVFKYMTDANGCIDSLNESVILNDTAISVNVIHQGFSCDSAKHKVQIIAQGKSPLQLNYTKNGVSQTQVLSSGTNTLYFENGNYTFANLSDANTCMAFINQSFLFNDSLPNFAISNGGYVCDSNKTIIYLNASGTAPYQISYTRNLVPELYSTSSLEDSLLLNNGTYVFKYMTDANGCIDSLNESIILNDTAISVNVIHQGFSCDSAKHKVQIIAQGKSPLQLNYTKNGVSQTQVLSSGTNTLYFENGNYTFSNLSDANTCMAFINQTFMFNDSLPNFAISNGVYVCDSNKTIIYLNASGTAPYQISYTRNLVPELYSTSSLEDSILLNNGTYVFKYMADANGCIDSLNESVILNDTAISVNVIHQGFSCDSAKHKVQIIAQGKSPLQLIYTKNGVSQTQVLSSGTNTLYFENGNYTFSNLSDANTCMAFINQSFMFNDSLPNLAISNGGYVCDSNKTIIYLNASGTAPYQISYTKNNILVSFTTIYPTINKYLDKGNYNFINIKDANGCITTVNKIENLTEEKSKLQLLDNNYDCINRSQNYIFKCNGLAPYKITYLQNGNVIDTIFSDSLFNFSISHGVIELLFFENNSGCIDTLNYNINFPELVYSKIINNEFSCSENKHNIEFELKGESPYKILYFKDNVFDSLYTTSINFQKYLDNGTYLFTKILDNRNCESVVDSSFIVNIDTSISFKIISENVYLISSKTNGVKYIWYKNELMLQDTLPEIAMSGNGVYRLEIVDINGCIRTSNEVIINNDFVNIYPNPLRQIDEKLNVIFENSKQERFAVKLIDERGRSVYEVNTTNSFVQIPTKAIANGNYYISILNLKNENFKVGLKVQKVD